MKHPFAWPLGLLTTPLLVLGIALILATQVEVEIDATAYKSQLAEALSEWSGLDVSIDGPVHLWTGPRCGLSLENLRVSEGTPTEAAPGLLSGDRAALRLDTLALLGGRIRPTLILLHKTELRLPEPSATGAAPQPPVLPLADLAHWLGSEPRLEIRDSRLITAGGSEAALPPLELANAVIEPDGASWRVDIDGILNDRPLRIKGRVATLTSAAASDGTVPRLALTGDVLGLRIEATVSPPDLASDANAALTLTAKGEGLAALAPWIGAELATEGRLDLRLQSSMGANGLRVEALDARLTERELHVTGGEVSVSSADGILLRDARVAYRAGPDASPVQADVERLHLAARADALVLGFDGRVDGHALLLQGRTAPVSALTDLGQPIPLKLQGRLSDVEVVLDGTLTRRDQTTTLDLSLDINGPSLAGVGPWLGGWANRSGAFAAKLRINGSGQRYRVAPLTLRVGPQRWDGQAQVHMSPLRPRVDVKIALDRLDLRRWLASLPGSHPSSAPDARASLLDRPLRLTWMDAADIRARLEIKRLTTPLVANTAAGIDLDLTSGVLRITADDIAVGAEPVEAQLRLDGKAKPAKARLQAKGRELAIAPMLSGTMLEGSVEGVVDLALDLSTTGASLGAMLDALDGELLLLAEGARADLHHLQKMTPGVQDLFGLVTTPNSELARVNCAAGALRFTRGRADVAALIDAASSTVVGQGSLDLDAKTIDVRLTPSPKGVHLRLTAPVAVRGPLAAPAIQVEKGKLMVSAASLLSKVLLPERLFIDAFGAAVAKDPCVALASGGASAAARLERQAADLAETTLGVVGGAVEGTGHLVEDAGSGVSRAAGGLIEEAGGEALGGAGHLIEDIGEGVAEGAGDLLRDVGQSLEGIAPE
jgi:uncharacterized protein involved in outer membrane biogenesis